MDPQPSWEVSSLLSLQALTIAAANCQMRADVSRCCLAAVRAVPAAPNLLLGSGQATSPSRASAFASEDGGNVPRPLGLAQGPMSLWRPQGDTGHAGAALQDPLPLLWPEAVETSAETWEEEHGTRCQAQSRAIAAAAPPAGSLPPREG